MRESKLSNPHLKALSRTATRRRRVCFVLPAHWESYLGGAQYQAKFIVEALANRGDCDVTYIAPKAESGRRAKYRVVRLPGSFTLRRIGHLFDMPVLVAMLCWFRPDVIYQRSASAHTGIVAAYARVSGCKLVWHIANERNLDGRYETRGTPWRIVDYLESRIMFFGMRRADVVIAQTKRQAAMLGATFGRFANAVIPNFHPAASEDLVKSSPIRVLWVANWKKSKRPELFVELARELSNPELHEFRMIGVVNEAEAWQRELRLQAQAVAGLTVLGGLSQEEVNKELAQACLLVNTSTVEGFSNTFIQAWLREVPVASLDADPDGLIETKRLGFCAKGDYTRLREGVASCIRNVSALRDMGDRAYRHARAAYSMSNVTDVVRLIVDDPLEVWQTLGR